MNFLLRNKATITLSIFSQIFSHLIYIRGEKNWEFFIKKSSSHYSKQKVNFFFTSYIYKEVKKKLTFFLNFFGQKVKNNYN